MQFPMRFADFNRWNNDENWKIVWEVQCGSIDDFRNFLFFIELRLRGIILRAPKTATVKIFQLQYVLFLVWLKQ